MLVEQPHQGGIGHGIQGGSGLGGGLGLQHGVELLVGGRQPLLAGGGALFRPGARLVVGIGSPGGDRLPGRLGEVGDPLPGFLAGVAHRGAKLGGRFLQFRPVGMAGARCKCQDGGNQPGSALHCVLL
ncbi:hypothetical protein D3C84_807720 [compost metagenome]